LRDFAGAMKAEQAKCWAQALKWKIQRLSGYVHYDRKVAGW
jgi:hypothetical protein